MTAYRRADGVLAETLDGRAALVNPSGTELFTLNPVGSVVWEALEGNQELDALVDAVLAACGPVERGVVTTDVQRFVDELCELELIVRA